MIFLQPSTVPQPVQGEGTLVNYGPGTVLWGDDNSLSVDNATGIISVGGSVRIDGTLYLIAVGANASLDIRPPVGAPPATGLRLATFGHSYNDPNFPVGVSLRKDLYGSRMAALLGMPEDNYHVAGTYSIQGTGNMYDRVVIQYPALPTTPPLRAKVNAAAIYTGHNDISPSLQPTIATEPTILVDWLRASIRHLRGGSAAHVSNAPMVLAGGTWSTTSSASWFGGSLRFATQNGCTWTLTLPATFPGGSVEIWGMRNSATGATHTITVGGQAWDTWDTRGATTATNRPTFKEITGLPAGSSVVQGTISNLVGAVEHLNYWQIPHPDPPPVVYFNVCRTPSAANGQSDGVVATFRPLLAAVAREFGDGRVVCIEADDIFSKDSTMFGDGTHPSVKGAALVAEAGAEAMRPLLATRPSTTSVTDSVLAPSAQRALMLEQITGADPAFGTVTLVAGAATITSRRLNANSHVILTPIGPGTGAISRGATITATNSATSGSVGVASSDAADTRVVAYLILQVA